MSLKRGQVTVVESAEWIGFFEQLSKRLDPFKSIGYFEDEILIKSFCQKLQGGLQSLPYDERKFLALKIISSQPQRLMQHFCSLDWGDSSLNMWFDLAAGHNADAFFVPNLVEYPNQSLWELDHLLQRIADYCSQGKYVDQVYDYALARSASLKKHFTSSELRIYLNGRTLTQNQVQALLHIQDIFYRVGCFDFSLVIIECLLTLNIEKINQNSTVLNRLAICLWKAGRVDESHKLYQSMIDKFGDYTSTYNYSRRLLAIGDVSRGIELAADRWLWRDYPAVKLTFSNQIKKWKGEPLDGKTIIFWGEQGVADQLLGLSFIPSIQKKFNPRSIIILCGRKLFKITRDWFSGAVVGTVANSDCTEVDFGEAVSFHIPVYEIVRYWLYEPFKPPFKLTKPNVNVPRLLTSVKRNNQLFVGLIWRSHISTTARAGHDKSGFFFPSLTSILKLINAAPEQISFVCLQHALRLEEKNLLSRTPRILLLDQADALFDDLEAMRDLICSLDGLVSYFSIPAYLASLTDTDCCTWTSRNWALYGLEHPGAFTNLRPFIYESNHDHLDVQAKVCAHIEKFLLQLICSPKICTNLS